MLLQLTGFILVAVVVGLLLESRGLGIWNGKPEEKLSKFSEYIDKSFYKRIGLEKLSSSQGKSAIGKPTLASLQFENLGNLLVPFFTGSFFIIGVLAFIEFFVSKNSLYFWGGSSLFLLIVVYVSWLCLRVVKQMMAEDKFLIPPLSFYAIKQAIVLTVIIFPSVLIFFTISSIPIVFLVGRLVFSKQLFETSQFFARKEMLNKFLIVLGTISILIGITLQFIFTFIQT